MSHELSWEDLIEEIERIKAPGPFEATWHAYVGSEDYGIWLLPSYGPRSEERRASFSLFAARAISKCGIPPVPVPQPLEHCPHWRTICESEEEFARLAGNSLDFSDAVPYGLGTIDRDAVDPCTRAWLELLRLESHAFRIFSYGTQTIRGTAYPTVGGTIDDLCGASAAYGKRRARDEIGSRLMEPSAQRKFEKTPEGQRYLDGLPELAELPAAREIPGHTEALPSKPQPQRKAVVLPILQQRGMTRSRWATKAGVDPSVVYDYLENNSHPRPESRKALEVNSSRATSDSSISTRRTKSCHRSAGADSATSAAARGISHRPREEDGSEREGARSEFSKTRS